MRRPLISADLFRARGDEWMTNRDKERLFGEAKDDNPDLDQFTKASYKGSDSRLTKDVVFSKKTVSTRDPALVKRTNFMFALSRKVHS